MPLPPVTTQDLYPWWMSTGELPSNKATPFDATSGNNTLRRDYERNFQVLCNSILTDPMLACYAPFIPRPFTPYVTPTALDTRALVVKLTASRMDDKENTPQYRVTVMYSTELPKNGPFDAGQPNKGDKSPEDEPPEISWEFEEVTTSYPYDLDNKFYVNSALQPILNPPKREGSRAILVYTRNELQFDATRAATYANTANSKEIAGRRPGSLLNMAPKAVSKWKGNVPYFRVTYRIKFGMRINFAIDNINQDGTIEHEIQDYEDFRFHYEIDQGFAELKPVFQADGTTPVLVIGANPVAQKYQWVNIKDSKHQPLHKPALLDGKGNKLPFQFNNNGVPMVQKPYFQKFRIREETDFNDFLTGGF